MLLTIWMQLMMVLWIPVRVQYLLLPFYINSVVGVVKAFDQAWQWDKANCATYYR